MQATVTRAWYKCRSAPTVKSFPGGLKVAYAGFVVLETGELYTSEPERFNYETTIGAIRAFLQAWPVPESKHYVFFLDNVPWHAKPLRLIQKEQLEDTKTLGKPPPWKCFRRAHPAPAPWSRSGESLAGRIRTLSSSRRLRSWKKTSMTLSAHGANRTNNRGYPALLK